MKTKETEKIRFFLVNNRNNLIYSAASVGCIYFNQKDYKKVGFFCGGLESKKDTKEVNNNTFYDLASLTKPLVTVLALLALIKDKRIQLDEKIEDILPVKVPNEKKSITVEQLLKHCSGFPAHREYFKVLRYNTEGCKRETLIQLLLMEKLISNPGDKYIYSDLGYMLLGILIEIRSGGGLGGYWREKIIKPLHMSSKFKIFGEVTEKDKNSFAVTGRCPWSNIKLQGVVHDDNCRAFAKIMGHTGLFSTLEGVLELCKVILLHFTGEKKHPSIDTQSLLYLLRRRNMKRWAYGFDIRSEKKPSSGKYFSQHSVGHLGFTGTSFWIDLLNRVIVVVLTNRVIYGGTAAKIKKFRPLVHDEIMKYIGNKDKVIFS